MTTSSTLVLDVTLSTITIAFLLPHLRVCGRQDLKDVHDEPIKHMFGTRGIELVEDNESDVVIQLFDDELEET